MDAPMPRQVTLVLCLPDGRLLGVLPTFEVIVPWWQSVREVVDEVRARNGVHVTVLRRLESGDSAVPPGGAVTYLAEIASAPGISLPAWTGTDPNADQRNRLPWARPGGPAADLAWADAALLRCGQPRENPAVQIRSWNLSSIWALPTAAGTAWLKVVPPFFAHEGDVLAMLPAGVVPSLLAHDRARVLMAGLAGEDLYGAELPAQLRMVTLLTALQASYPQRLPDLVALGLPDWRHAAVADRFADTFTRTAGQLDAATCASVDNLLAGLADRYADLASCGIPDTLVHGDFHPGNVRGDDKLLVLLDWGDCGIGNPLLDQAAFLDSVRPEDLGKVKEHWAAQWRAAVPGSDPARAAELIAPVAALRQALIYRVFLDGIEPDEHVYHRDDPARWLRRAAELTACT